MVASGPGGIGDPPCRTRPDDARGILAEIGPAYGRVRLGARQLTGVWPSLTGWAGTTTACTGTVWATGWTGTA